MTHGYARLVELLAEGHSHTEVARRLNAEGVQRPDRKGKRPNAPWDRWTVGRALRIPDVSTLIAEAEQEARDHARRMMTRLLPGAISALGRQLARDAPPAVQVSAAKIVIDRALPADPTRLEVAGPGGSPVELGGLRGMSDADLARLLARDDG